ncbi:MAG: hypothetical protein PVI39_10060, partial [Desulfobacteraceae bacterium]
ARKNPSFQNGLICAVAHFNGLAVMSRTGIHVPLNSNHKNAHTSRHHHRVHLQPAVCVLSADKKR